MTMLKTPRLLLRPPEAEDADALVRGLNNLAVSRWTARIPYPYGAGDADAFLAQTMTPPAGVERLAITLNGELIGVIGVEGGELGYWIAEPFWGRGLATEAARAVVDHAFSEGTCDSLAARYQLGNEASRRILVGLGFQEQGEAEGFCRATGEATRVMTLALSASRWAGARERR